MCTEGTAPVFSTGQVESTGLRLANLDGAMGHISGAAINFRFPCTIAEGRTCQIVRHLSVWNEFLCQAHLELRELPALRSQLCLGGFDGPHPVDTLQDQLHEAATLVYLLLTNHTCVTALDIGPLRLNEYEALLCSSLQKNISIRNLKLRFPRLEVPKAICSLMSSMKMLENLECCSVTDCSEPFLRALTKLLVVTSSLTVLNLSELPMKCRASKEFLIALRTNSSVKEVSLHGSSLNETSRTVFRDYLLCTKTLTSLSVVADKQHSHLPLSSILEDLLKNKTLAHLNFTGFAIDTKVAELLMKFMAVNMVLRSFKLISSQVNFGPQLQSVADYWLMALHENESLKEIRLPYSLLGPEQWCLLFAVLQAKANLQKIVIELNTVDTEDLTRTYEALKTMPEGKVSVVNSHICCVFYFCKCSTFSHFSSCLGFGTQEQFLKSLQHIPLLSRVTSVHLDIWISFFDDVVSSAITHYIEETTALKTLHLISWCNNIFTQTTTPLWRDIVVALSCNATISELRLRAVCMNTEDVALLAAVVASSKRIQNFHFIPQRTSCAFAFLQALSSGVAENTTLLSFTLHWGVNGDMVKAWFAVSDATRRNSGLVTRAAQFVIGARNDRCCAQSLERVACHPFLPEKIAELLSVSESKAAMLLQEGVDSLADLNNFMRLSGVVRERVVCRTAQGARLYLDALDDQCWRRIRRYLTLDDVREPASPSQKLYMTWNQRVTGQAIGKIQANVFFGV
ncbi:uncharacterized protein [Dermacentor albipictus]|uniref:uncharacterized protein n=1 Tax=Dermacentor albipictus TaxID=60249 RepID=UPI0031FDE27E